MRRILVLILCLAAGLVSAATAAAYPWPVRPFKQAHPVRANFGDPRTVFQMTLFQNGMTGPGAFSFHNGVDISAPDGTRVYPVVSGTVTHATEAKVSVRTEDGRAFQYEHIVPVVTEGETVTASKTLLGYVARTYGHVHFAEIRGSLIWNPLAKGGLAPYRDATKPRVAAIWLRSPGTLGPLDPLGVCGTVEIVADASDTPQLKVPGSFAGFPVSPAYVAWSLRKVGGAVYQPTIAAADFRTTQPRADDFWTVYARGTYQNAPRFGNRQFALMPGRFLYTLNNSFDTTTVPNGVYQVGVRAEDMRGNVGILTQRFTIVNTANTPTGCPA